MVNRPRNAEYIVFAKIKYAKYKNQVLNFQYSPLTAEDVIKKDWEFLSYIEWEDN